jgi:hypothetical protein
MAWIDIQLREVTGRAIEMAALFAGMDFTYLLFIYTSKESIWLLYVVKPKWTFT